MKKTKVMKSKKHFYFCIQVNTFTYVSSGENLRIRQVA